MIRRPPRSTRVRSSAASDVYKRQQLDGLTARGVEFRRRSRDRALQEEAGSEAGIIGSLGVNHGPAEIVSPGEEGLLQAGIQQAQGGGDIQLAPHRIRAGG